MAAVSTIIFSTINLEIPEWRGVRRKSSNPTKGYGFIQPQGGAKDVFVNSRQSSALGLSTLNEGQQIEHELEGIEVSLPE